GDGAVVFPHPPLSLRERKSARHRRRPRDLVPYHRRSQWEAIAGVVICAAPNGNHRRSTMQPPGPSRIASIPAALTLLRDPRRLIADYARRYGRVFRTFIPDRGRLVPLVWLMGPDGNERILGPAHKADFSWYEGYRFTMEPLFGRDILF